MIETLFKDEVDFEKFKAQYILHFRMDKKESFRDILNRKLLTWHKNVEESRQEQNILYKMLADCMNTQITEATPWYYEINWWDLVLNKIYRQLWNLIWPKIMGSEFGALY